MAFKNEQMNQDITFTALKSNFNVEMYDFCKKATLQVSLSGIDDLYPHPWTSYVGQSLVSFREALTWHGLVLCYFIDRQKFIFWLNWVKYLFNLDFHFQFNLRIILIKLLLDKIINVFHQCLLFNLCHIINLWCLLVAL